jgi:hypothetical protein
VHLVTARAWLAPALLLAATLAGCFAPAYENGKLQCNRGECPEGYYCASGTDRCWRQGTVPPLTETDADMPNGPSMGDGGVTPDSPMIDPGDASPDQTPPPPPDAFDVDVVDDPAIQLLSLEIAPGHLSPTFTPVVPNYGVDLPLFTPSITVKATAQDPGATLVLNGMTYPNTLSADVAVPVGLSEVDLIVRGTNGKQTRYRVFVTTGAAVTYVKPPDTHIGMAFGRAMAMVGNTLVVGAPDDKGLGAGPQTGETEVGTIPVGAVFVYAHSDGWRREVTLKPLEVQPQMGFGAAVALAGDTLVVGAPGESGPEMKADMAGAAYVFVKGADGWSQQAYLKAADAAVGDQFGSSVAISTSTTPAGMTTTLIAVGAPGAARPASSARAGAVYVFSRTIGPGVAPAWIQHASPKPANPKAGNEFGASVALTGDNLMVGAPFEDGGATGVNPGATGSSAADSGAVFLFTRSGTMWPQSGYIKAPTASNLVNFGMRLAIAGQYLAVSSPRDGAGVREPSGVIGPPRGNSGAVNIYQRNGNGWIHQTTIKASNAHEADQFGFALALSPTTLVVGAPFEDTDGAGVVDPTINHTALDSGATYVFRIINGHWTELVRLKAPNAEAGDNFGNAVATDGDFVAAGAEGESSGERTIDGNQGDNSAPGSGAVYVY